MITGNRLTRSLAFALVAASATLAASTSRAAAPRYDGLCAERLGSVTEKGDCRPRLSLSDPHQSRRTGQWRLRSVHHLWAASPRPAPSPSSSATATRAPPARAGSLVTKAKATGRAAPAFRHMERRAPQLVTDLTLSAPPGRGSSQGASLRPAPCNNEAIRPSPRSLPKRKSLSSRPEERFFVGAYRNRP